MIWTIAKKEFFEKILDFRVIISFVIALMLTVVVAFVVGEDYKASKARYDQEVVATENEYRSIRVFGEFSREVIFPPSPLSVFSKGSGLPAPMSVTVSATKVPKFEPKIAASNVFLRIYDSLDLVTVFRILFALLVILLTFDSFSGEKESGTLRLVMSTSAGRLQLFFGKVLGAFLVVSAVNLATYALAMLGVQWVSGIAFAGVDYLRASLILCVTVLYMLVFASLGICASLLFRHSSTSLVVSLLVWFLTAIVQPNLNTFLATELFSVPRFKDVEPALVQREEEVDKEIERFEKERQPLNKTRTSYGSDTRITDAEYEVLESAIEKVYIRKKYIEAAEEGWRRYQQVYLEPLRRQAALNFILDLVSPAAQLKRSVPVLSCTDVDNYETFFEKARQYRSQCSEYLNRKGVFSTNAQLYFSRLKKEDINAEATGRRMELYKKDPSTIPWIHQQPPLDLSDAPSYRVTEASVMADTSRIVPNVGLLLLYSVLLGIGAIAALNKYDVR